MAVFDLKSIFEVLKAQGRIELSRDLLDFEEKYHELREENSNLKDKIKALEFRLEIKRKIFFDLNSYWIESEGKRSGPFCPRCYDDESKVIHMVPSGSPDYYRCPKCKELATIRNGKPFQEILNRDDETDNDKRF
jgi:hypothetical protein